MLDTENIPIEHGITFLKDALSAPTGLLLQLIGPPPLCLPLIIFVFLVPLDSRGVNFSTNTLHFCSGSTPDVPFVSQSPRFEVQSTVAPRMCRTGHLLAITVSTAVAYLGHWTMPHLFFI